MVGLTPTADGHGYWLVAGDGGVFAFGSARFEGSAVGTMLHAPVVGIAATPDGGGYWLVASDGGVFSYGDAPFLGCAVASGQRFSGIVAWDRSSYSLVTPDGRAVHFGGAATTHAGGRPAGVVAARRPEVRGVPRSARVTRVMPGSWARMTCVEQRRGRSGR